MTERKIFYLWFDSNDNRYQRDGYGLHCGDGVDVQINGAWHETRIEHSCSITHSHGWYLYHFPHMALEGLPVKKST